MKKQNDQAQKLHTPVASAYPVFWACVDALCLKDIKSVSIRTKDERDSCNLHLLKASILHGIGRKIEAYDEITQGLIIYPKSLNALFLREVLKEKDKRLNQKVIKRGPATEKLLYPNNKRSDAQWCLEMKKMRKMFLLEANKLVISYSQGIDTPKLSLGEIVEFHLMRGASLHKLDEISDSAIAFRIALELAPKHQKTQDYIKLIKDWEQFKNEPGFPSINATT